MNAPLTASQERRWAVFLSCTWKPVICDCSSYNQLTARKKKETSRAHLISKKWPIIKSFKRPFDGAWITNCKSLFLKVLSSFILVLWVQVACSLFWHVVLMMLQRNSLKAGYLTNTCELYGLIRESSLADTSRISFKTFTNWFASQKCRITCIAGKCRESAGFVGRNWQAKTTISAMAFSVAFLASQTLCSRRSLLKATSC